MAGVRGSECWCAHNTLGSAVANGEAQQDVVSSVINCRSHTLPDLCTVPCADAPHQLCGSDLHASSFGLICRDSRQAKLQAVSTGLFACDGGS